MTLVRVLGPGFVAGFVLDANGVCVRAAPVVRRWTLGRTADEIRAEILRRGLRAHVVRPRKARG